MTLRQVWAIGLGIALLPFAVWTAVRLLGAERGAPAVQLMAFTPYVAAASLLPLLAAAVSRLWWHTGVAAVLAVALVACVVPRALPGSGAPSTGPLAAATAGGGHRTQLRILSSNLYLGAADPGALVDLVRSRRVDVLAVQELTAQAVQRLDGAGLGELLPYRAAYPHTGARGSAVFSRFPLTAPGLRTLPSGMTQAWATVQVPGAGAVQVESAHPCAPSDAVAARGWAHDIAQEPAASPAEPPRVLLGDFNSTLDHRGLRAVLTTGYRDVAAELGAGLSPTWPFLGEGVLGLPIPPVTLDHVLADRRIGLADVSVYPVTGSDHRAVYATLMLPSS